MSKCKTLGRLTSVLSQDTTKHEDLRTYPIAAVICGSYDVKYSSLVLCHDTLFLQVSMVCKFPETFKIRIGNPMECALAMPQCVLGLSNLGVCNKIIKISVSNYLIQDQFQWVGVTFVVHQLNTVPGCKKHLGFGLMLHC